MERVESGWRPVSIEKAIEIGYTSPISKTLYDQLMKIAPSISCGLEYRPCQATLENGEVYDRVYFVTPYRYISCWGIWPEDDKGKRSISIKDVKHIRESPYRLPAEFANRLYEAEQNIKDGYMFKLSLADGRKLLFAMVGTVDFPNIPPDIDMNQVVDAVPYQGEDFVDRAPKENETGADYYWCIYLPPIGISEP